MKHLGLSFWCLWLCGSLWAQSSPILQQTSIGTAPLGFITKLRCKVEYMPQDQKVTFGSFASFHHPLLINGANTIEYLGVTVEPFIRWYSLPNAEQFYFQTKAFIGYMHYEYLIGSGFWLDYAEGQFFAFGGGAGVGYQYWFGKSSHWFLDMSLSLRISTASGDPIEFFTWYWSGPGSFLNPSIIVGRKLFKS